MCVVNMVQVNFKTVSAFSLRYLSLIFNFMSITGLFKQMRNIFTSVINTKTGALHVLK